MQTTQYAGDVSTETGGSGLEFFSVRDYRPGDPMKWVDWNKLSKTGELATINYRKEQTATVTLLSALSVTRIRSQRPASASSMELSTTS